MYGRLAILLILVLPLAARGQSISRSPIASLIEAIPDPSGFQATVRGRPGAALPNQTLSISTLANRATIRVTSSADGSFQTTVDGSPGDPVDILHGTRDAAPQKMAGSTTVRIGSAGEVLEGGARVGRVSGLLGGGGRFRADITIDRGRYSSGSVVAMTAQLNIFSSQVAERAGQIRDFRVFVGAERFFDEAGREKRDSGILGSTYLAPTGVPVCGTGYSFVTLLEVAAEPFTVDGAITTARFAGEVPLTVPDGPRLPDGHYRLLLVFSAMLDTNELVRVEFLPASLAGVVEKPQPRPTWSPLFALGNPAQPRLTWLLLGDRVSNGSIGTVAAQDRAAYQMANYDGQQGPFVLAREDRDRGSDPPYRLEPTLPLIGAMTTNLAFSADDPLDPYLESLPLDFAKGSVAVEVHRPDGATDRLGTHPFRQPVSRVGVNMLLTGEAWHDALGATALTSSTWYGFPAAGENTVRMTGTMQSVWGDVFQAGGDYQVTVADQLLALEPSFLPGTPLETGDQFSPAVLLHPGVPGDVELDLLYLPFSDPARQRRTVIRGRANSFGYFAPAPGEAALVFDEPGEYTLVVRAEYRAPGGKRFAGTRQGSGVIAPKSTTLVAHGRRGIRGVDQVTGSRIVQLRDQERFDLRSEGGTAAYPDLEMFYPYHSGDILYVASDGNAKNRIYPILRVEDTSAELGRDYFLDRLPDPLPNGEGDANSTIPSDELPLTITGPIFKGSVLSYPDQIDRIGYAYNQSFRSGFSVRGFASTELAPAFPYWSVSPNGYSRQIGVGPIGDLPGDVKTMYGGVVLRDLNRDFARYAIYGSLAVILPKGANANRVSAPLAEPLVTIRGKPYHIFLTWPAVPPGTVLVTGDTFIPSGYVHPTIEAEILVVVTSPSGRKWRFAARSNKVGYWSSASEGMRLLEPGTYEVFWCAMAGGREGGYPGGAVRTKFHVVAPGDRLLPVGFAPGFTEQPANQTLAVTSPSELLSTLRMGEFQLSETRSTIATYDARSLAREFPNLDVDTLGTGAGLDRAWDQLSWTLYSESAGRRSVRIVHLRGCGDQMLYPTDEGSLRPAACSAETTALVPLEAGLNLITLPVQPSAGFDSAALARAAGSPFVARAARRAGSPNILTASVEGIEGTTFALEPGRGYLLSVPSARALTLTGCTWGRGDRVVELGKGVELIGLPLGPATTTTLGALAGTAGSLWIGSTAGGRFDARPRGDAQIAVNRSAGYIVSVSSARIVTLPGP